jgi:hypothetical protein
MKKLLQITAISLVLLSVLLIPSVARAEDAEPVDDSGVTTSLPDTGAAEEVSAPDTGIAPSGRVAQNTAVFVGGSLLGAGIGFGVVTLRKKKFNQ